MGHTLDLIITREESSLIQTTPISHCFLTDHSTVLCNMTLRKPAFSVKKLSYRKIKAIDTAVFKEDLLRSDLCGDALWELDELVICYNDSCSTILDRHAPLIKKTVTVRPRVPWFNDNIKAVKRERLKYERIWRASGLGFDRLTFTRARNHANHVIEQARRDYCKDFIDENSSDQRRLFNAVNQLLGGTREELYPPHLSPKCLVNDFCQFFVQKIANIRAELDATEPVVDIHNEPARSNTFTGVPFTEFEAVLQEAVRKLVSISPAKSCETDPIPTSVVKECLDELLPALSTMVNLSLETGHFPDTWKGALVKRKLKKPGLKLVKENYRPVSNLPFFPS